MQNGTKWLVGLVAVLIIANIVLVATLWLKKEHISKPQQGGDARDYLVKTLSMDAAQTKTFDNLREEHFQRMKGYQSTMRDLKDRFFDQLSSPRTPLVDTLASQIGALQTRIDLETYDHFSRVRALLREDQKSKFDNTIQEVIRTMRPKGPPPSEHPGNIEGPPGDGPDGPPPPGGPPQ